MTHYPAELKMQIVFEVLRGATTSEIAMRHGVPEHLVADWTLRISQKAHSLFSDGAASREAAPGAQPHDQRLCFLHIEKTAGTTISSIIEDFFDCREICPPALHEELEQLALRQDLKPFALFRGHFFLGWFLDKTELRLENTRFITFLRHPLQRHVSVYKHWCRQPVGMDHVNPLLVGHNVQCLRLTPLPMRRGYATMREHLEAAKAVLDKFFFVGLQEQLPQSLNALCARLGYPPPSEIRRLNIDPNTYPELPQTMKDEILSSNWADRELYDHAEKLFVEKFIHVNCLDGCSVNRTAEPAGQIAYRIEQPLYGDGWHWREGLGTQHPQPWRWTGPGTESWIEFQIIPDCSYSLSMRIVNFLAPDVLASLRIYVNDHEIALAETRDTQWGLILHGMVPAYAIPRGQPRIRIRLTINRTIRFCDADPKSQDQRQCGIAISEINLTPA